MSKKEKPKRELGTEERRLEVQLTEEEKVQAGQDLAGQLDKIIEAELELEGIRKKYKGRISEHQAEVRRLAHMVNKGTERRPVVCTWLAADRNNKILVRVDTAEVVETMPLTDEDRQLALE